MVGWLRDVFPTGAEGNLRRCTDIISRHTAGPGCNAVLIHPPGAHHPKKIQSSTGVTFPQPFSASNDTVPLPHSSSITPIMQIQQAIIVIMLTAVISIFVGMVSMSVYPPTQDASISQFNKLSRTVMFGFILIPWVFIVCITDLYMTQGAIQQDVTQMLSQCGAGRS